MLAIQMENNLSNENQNVQPKTCEYKGLTYFVLTDMNGRCFINIDGKFLRKEWIQNNPEKAKTLYGWWFMSHPQECKDIYGSEMSNN